MGSPAAVQLSLTGVGPTCEKCAGPIDPPDQATVGGYTRCTACDPDGDHWGWAYGDEHDDDQAADDARMDAVGWEVDGRKQVIQLERSGHVARDHQPGDPRTWLMVRRGKKDAGRELDGRTWDEYPAGEQGDGRG